MTQPEEPLFPPKLDRELQKQIALLEKHRQQDQDKLRELNVGQAAFRYSMVMALLYQAAAAAKVAQALAHQGCGLAMDLARGGDQNALKQATDVGALYALVNGRNMCLDIESFLKTYSPEGQTVLDVADQQTGPTSYGQTSAPKRRRK